MARKNKSPFDASSLLKSSAGTLAQIATKTKFLSQLEDIIRQSCPDLPEQVWHISNFNQNTCVIGVSSAVWSQRLQFERMNICRKLADITQGQFNQIDIKVRPFANQIAKESEDSKPRKHLSKNTAKQLEAVAEHASDSLKQKILNLAKLADR
ncbi:MULTISPECIES: DUF721 domain-containing protein [Thalassotalea]|uniref:DUF721 domain-containing protein n=1 Tax=Thalassotalea TaxID=1518149 RepID=UPI00094510D0|nr:MULTISPECIES: DciA family protein [Thalassotalea]OKY26482.1 hypothetical protein BI291_11715 [Thalassotalea sp. PP2-459]